MKPLRIVLAPDSFKGSLTASEVAQALARGLLAVWPQAELLQRPLADGGEGTLEAVLARGGKAHRATVTNAAGAPQQALWAAVPWQDQPAALLEAAQVVPITDAGAMRTSVMRRSTLGLGQLVRFALDADHRQLLFALGGTSTNDGGAGLLNALGLQLIDAQGRKLAPTPEGLEQLHSIDVSGLDARLAECQITVLSDVNNPLGGKSGATAIFGPQKGVPAEDVHRLDRHLERFANLCETALGRSVQKLPGSGAAGGLGFALQLLGARLCSGAEIVADLVDLDAALAGADWLITGEGRSEAQTLMGKAPWVAASRAARQGVPATLVSGSIDRAALPQLEPHFAGCFALPFGPLSLSEAIDQATPLLQDKARQLAQLFAASRSSSSTDKD